MPASPRHFTPIHRPWDAREAARAIEAIVADTLDHRDPDGLWPAHPSDGGVADGHSSLYFGGAGVIWGLNRLGISDATVRGGYERLLRTALDENRTWFSHGPYPQHASLLFGDLGILLTQMRISPSDALADRIHDRITANSSLPVVELMWGLPGSMLACVFMRDLVGQARFEGVFRTQAERLLAEADTMDDGVMWTQHLYGQRVRYLSAVHGFAGNLLALLRGWDWLSSEQRARLAHRVPCTLAATAVAANGGVNWPAVLPHAGPAELCQHCHGAPGIVTALADAPFSSPAFDRHLIGGGEYIWRAGPLTKGANLCHGTAGNGYAFLKLFTRTRDALWLERARAFAMVALDQVQAARASLGRGRYSLWTGDIGTALYLRACIGEDAAFPTIDVL